MRRRGIFAALISSVLVLTALPAHAGVAEDRDVASTTKLLSFFDANTGAWTTPTGEAWQPALAVDAVINSYEQTRNPAHLNVIEKSFARYVGRRSHFFDDDGWYLNAWLRAYDVTGDAKFLTEAQSLFANMTTAWDSTCGGGVWWNKDRMYKNAITNELFLLAAARLHRRAPNGTGPGSYLDWALREWDWFNRSGMINGSNFVNDGLNSSCTNNGGITWTYNQGVILGGLVELFRINGDRGYLYRAELIAEATINGQVHAGGVLREPCETFSQGCDGDQLIFKGVFAQGLTRLYNADRGNKPGYFTFLSQNADSVWNAARAGDNGIGLRWVGPPDSPNAATHAAGSLLISGVALLNAGGETSALPPGGGSVLEAETATRTGVGTESTHSGFTGSGYVAGWQGDGQQVSFAVNSTTARTAIVTFRFATGAGDAYRRLTVNGTTRAGRLLLSGTGSWSAYRTVSFRVPLNAGTNTVVLAYDSGQGSSNWLNLDHLRVR